MQFGMPFSAVVKPKKPLLYICDQSTHITNIALCPLTDKSKDANKLTSLPPFVSVLKLQYEGPVIEGEHDENDQKEGMKPNKKKKNAPASDDDDEDDDDEDFEVDIEAKEVVIGTFTPNLLQMTTDIYLAPSDQYRFVLSGNSEYEVHLLGRYIPDGLPDDYDSEEDSDEDMDDLDLDQISTDNDSEGPRIEELDDDEEGDVKNNVKSVPSKQTRPKSPSTASNLEKPSKASGDKKSNGDIHAKNNKRPLEDKELDADVSMADSNVDTADGQPKLSKAQRKKLKKNKAAEAAAAASATDISKQPEAAKASPAGKPPPPSSITLPSGLKIVDTKQGQGADAKPGQSVAMRYIGKLTNGKVFDSNTKGKPFTFRLGKGEVIKGWDEGIKGMKIGGERKLTIPANLAYGKNGSPPDIPPNATLNFDVKLLAIK
ncbi:hypothetical protein O181_057438 [Austropuccinia psidii MF-1]|uniref:FK506-binding protein n=1 Tax=Austropuccinia psidii MF-1 TaxID=1389203 RepID=A0A9Q3EF02_9BASI|nr:hypothetical protein [Austropuccinia psidii MF-1]